MRKFRQAQLAFFFLSAQIYCINYITKMRIPDIRDPTLFQRLVRKLMICEHGLEYEVVDDSGGDGGLDGFNRTTGDLHAFYCPEKPSAVRFRQKFKNDLEKARLLRDEKHYPISRFIFITPDPLREPDQRMLRDLARNRGFEDGINISAEHLEVLFANHMEILPQFPEISYPQIEQKLDRVINVVEQMLHSQMSASTAQPSSKITGATAQILMLAVKAANKTVAGMAEAEELFRVLGLTKDQYKDGVDELIALGLVDISRSANAPGGYLRVRVRPGAFVQVATQVFPGVDIKVEVEKLLSAFGSGGGEYVLAKDILQQSSVPLARAQVLIDYLEGESLVETSMMGQSDSLLFYYGRILPLGKRILQRQDSLLI